MVDKRAYITVIDKNHMAKSRGQWKYTEIDLNLVG